MIEQLRESDPSRPPATATTKALRVLALATVIAITALVVINRDRAEEIAGYGYAGVFLVSMLSSATIFLPTPGFALIFAAGGVFNPILVGVVAGAGSAIGELSGYLAGYSGRGVFEKLPAYDRLEKLTDKYGGLVLFVLSVTPNPIIDLAGAAAGALRMPVPVFLVFTFAGKALRNILLAYAGAFSFEWFEQFLPN